MHVLAATMPQFSASLKTNDGLKRNEAEADDDDDVSLSQSRRYASPKIKPDIGLIVIRSSRQQQKGPQVAGATLQQGARQQKRKKCPTHYVLHLTVQPQLTATCSSFEVEV